MAVKWGHPVHLTWPGSVIAINSFKLGDINTDFIFDVLCS